VVHVLRLLLHPVLWSSLLLPLLHDCLPHLLLLLLLL
jgi:hypothetical protein